MRKIVRILRKLYYKIQIKKDHLNGLDFFNTQNFNESDYDKTVSVQYEPSRLGFDSIFKYLNISDKDSVLDIGCGKGKAIAMLSKYPFQYVDGYDISGQLCEIARKNNQLLGISNSRIYCANALEYDNYDGYNYFYLYNPVPVSVFEVVFENLNKSFRQNPRKINIINVNPKYQSIILANSDYKLERVIKSRLLRYVMHYYTNNYSE